MVRHYQDLDINFKIVIILNLIKFYIFYESK
jgi:hypothetical protein